MDDAENTIICLNYCRQDPETGYCQTCGRPPIPVTGIDLNSRTFAGVSLKGLSIASAKKPDES